MDLPASIFRVTGPFAVIAPWSAGLLLRNTRSGPPVGFGSEENRVASAEPSTVELALVPSITLLQLSSLRTLEKTCLRLGMDFVPKTLPRTSSSSLFNPSKNL